MAQSRINTIGVLFAGVSAAAVIVACEGPESFHGRSPGSVTAAGGNAGLGSAVGGGAGGPVGPGGLASMGGGDQPGAGGDSTAAGGTAGLGAIGGTVGGAGGDGGGHAASGGSAAGGSAEGGTSAVAGASGHAGGAGGASAGAAGGAGGGLMMAAAGMGGSAGCAPCALSIQCRNYAPADVTAMNAEIWISNTGAASIPLRQIKVRYYYLNEGGPMALEIFDKAFKQPDGTDFLSSAASFSMTTGKVAAPRMDFSDIAIGGNEVLAGTVPFYFKMSIHDQAHSRLDLSNDYSNGPATVGACPHIVAFVGGAVSAGVPPR
jgi:hypothetical protein